MQCVEGERPVQAAKQGRPQEGEAGLQGVAGQGKQAAPAQHFQHRNGQSHLEEEGYGEHRLWSASSVGEEAW